MQETTTAPDSPSPFSLAATFPRPFYYADEIRYHERKERERRNAPMHVKRTRSARYLAFRGAMEPEGATRDNLERVRSNHRLPVEIIRDTLKDLWEFRLLGWMPTDTLYLTWGQIGRFVRQGKRRPADTFDLMPAAFVAKRSPEEIEQMRHAAT